MREKLTKSDVEKIQAEIEERKLVIRPKCLEAVKEARAHGDLSENFEYHAAKKDKNQRNVCNCIESIDIGTYESCLNGCIYCYAIKGNYNSVEYNTKKHDRNSPLLIGHPAEDDVVKEREMKSLRNNQYSLF